MFNYCIECGSGLEVRQLPTEDRPRLVCPACGHVHYLNPKVVRGSLPVQEGKIWLLRRGIQPRYGYWTYPAGFQEWDESTEEAAIRETLEEIGCNIEIDGLFGVYSHANSPVVNIVYRAHLVPPHTVPSLSAEAIEVKAFSPEELPWSDLAFPSTERVLGDWVTRNGAST